MRRGRRDRRLLVLVLVLDFRREISSSLSMFVAEKGQRLIPPPVGVGLFYMARGHGGQPSCNLRLILQPGKGQHPNILVHVGQIVQQARRGKLRLSGWSALMVPSPWKFEILCDVSGPGAASAHFTGRSASHTVISASSIWTLRAFNIVLRRKRLMSAGRLPVLNMLCYMDGPICPLCVF